MARLKFSSPSEFDSGVHSRPRPDGLLDLLQSAIQAQSLKRQGADYTLQPSILPPDNSDTPPSGLLGRWLALQEAAQQQPRPFAGDSGQMPSAPADPNVRRLVRVSPAVESQGASLAGDGRVVVSDAHLDPLRAGSRYAQAALTLCGIGPGGCAVGGGITAGQAILAGVAASLGGATILNQKKSPARGRKTGDDEDDPDPDVWIERFRKQVAERARKRGEFRPTPDPGNDPRNYCSERQTEEIKNCYKRMHEYADWDFLNACRERASERQSRCVRNGGIPDPKEPAEWGLDEEETFRNLWR